MNIFTVARARRVLMTLLAAVLLRAVIGPVAAQTDLTSTPEPTPAESPAADATAEVTPTPSPTPAPPLDLRYGVIESFEDPGAAGRLRVAWTRARFQWADVQPGGPDEWEPPLDDEALALELDAGREVVGLLIGIPDWARDRRGLPRGLLLPYDDPDNTWAVFVGEAVGRYAGRIDRWIIWNEPDIDDPDAPGHTWDGTIEEFVQLQRVAYLAAKAANPESVVHLGAFTYFWDPGYFARFLNVVTADPAAADHNYYFDVATAHLYFQPNAVYNVLYAFRRTMDARGLSQPIWLVETNAPPMNDPYWEVDNWTLAVTLNEQAAFIPQAIAAALAAGAERVAVYKLKDTEGDRAANPEPFGLVRWDNSRRPAFDTYRVAIRLLAGATSAERERWDAVGQVRITQEGRSTTVMFARLPGPQEARVAATADEAEWVDMWGRGETIRAEDGFFTVELPGALCLQTIADYCMIGGTTYYLVQEDDGRTAAESQPPTPAREEENEGTGETDGSQTGKFLSRDDSPPATDDGTPTAAEDVEAAVAVEVQPTATSDRPAATPTFVVAPALAAVTPTPAATSEPVPSPGPNVQSAAGGDHSSAGALSQPGLIVLGLGVVLGAGLTGWLLFGRRGKA